MKALTMLLFGDAYDVPVVYRVGPGASPLFSNQKLVAALQDDVPFQALQRELLAI